MTKISIQAYVVFVTYPGSMKEYAYLCNIPGIVQGNKVLANENKEVTVVRTAAHDPRAVRYVSPVPNHKELQNAARRNEIHKRLVEIERELAIDRWKKLASRSPEAKKLLAEHKKLGG